MFDATARPEVMEDLMLVLFFASFLGFLVLERIRPARSQPRIRGWRLTGLLFFIGYFVIGTFSPLVWVDVMAAHQLVDASALGTIGGAIVGLLVLDLATYVWHYALHHVGVLWRWFHQVHHSAERIDTAGAFYFSPLDVVGFAFAGTLALVWAVGVTPEAALIANAIATVLAIFQHANVRTPSWLGYLVQRPEAHSLHHGRDVHAFNYGSLAIWDLVFGTWRNPATWTGANGLFDGSTRQLAAMLVGRDVTAAHEAQSRVNPNAPVAPSAASSRASAPATAAAASS